MSSNRRSYVTVTLLLSFNSREDRFARCERKGCHYFIGRLHKKISCWHKSVRCLQIFEWRNLVIVFLGEYRIFEWTNRVCRVGGFQQNFARRLAKHKKTKVCQGFPAFSMLRLWRPRTQPGRQIISYLHSSYGSIKRQPLRIKKRRDTLWEIDAIVVVFDTPLIQRNDTRSTFSRYHLFSS